MIREYSCQFGESECLNGIITVPANEFTSDTALILVTAGFTPKAGPFRLYTLIARKAATIGLVSMRFDLGGIGNSEQINPGQPLNIRTHSDIGQAIDVLKEKYGIHKFVLGGLCSGAEDSFKYAKDYDSVVGVILIDGHAYISQGYRFRFMFSRKFLNRVGRVILSRLGLLKLVHSSAESNLEGDKSGLVDYQQLDVEESTAILRILIARSTKLLYIYTAGMDDKFNSEKQFYEMFPKLDFRDSVTLGYLPRMGHVQLFEEDRNEICGVISRWLDVNFSSHH